MILNVELFPWALPSFFGVPEWTWILPLSTYCISGSGEIWERTRSRPARIGLVMVFQICTISVTFPLYLKIFVVFCIAVSTVILVSSLKVPKESKDFQARIRVGLLMAIINFALLLSVSSIFYYLHKHVIKS